jgi:hypothetical protein
MSPDPHTHIVLPVTVFGTDAEGKPFFQHVTAQDLSRKSAVLEGMEHRLKPGDTIGLQFKEHKTRALVVWSCEQEFGPTQVCVQLLPAEKCPWEQALDATSRRLVIVPPSPEPQRVH